MDNVIIQKGYIKLRGYTKVHRQDYLLLRIGFTDRHFVLYRLLFEALIDWDSRHVGHGTFEMDYRQVAYLLNWTEGKVRRVFNELCKRGFYRLRDKKQLLYDLVGYKELDQYRKGQKTDTKELFEYLEHLLELISNSNDSGHKMLLKFREIKQDFPKLEIRHKDQSVTKRQFPSKYSDNTVSSSDKSSYPIMDEDVDPNIVSYGMDNNLSYDEAKNKMRR